MLLLIMKKNLVMESIVIEGSVCIIFYFVKKEDFENYLSKFNRYDEKLFKDFFKIILNKIFLEIFGVNY